MNDHLRISRAKMAGFGWTERALGGLLVVLTLLLVLVVGLMILGVLVAGGLVLGGWLWWWRRHFLHSGRNHPLPMEDTTGNDGTDILSHSSALPRERRSRARAV